MDKKKFRKFYIIFLVLNIITIIMLSIISLFTSPENARIIYGILLPSNIEDWGNAIKITIALGIISYFITSADS